MKRGESIADLELYFVTSIECFGDVSEIPIVDGGSAIQVTNENLEEFVCAYIKWIAFTSVDKMYSSFLQGYIKLWNADMLKLFAPDELDILTSGEKVLDWDALEVNTQYIDGYTPDSQAVRWFWEVFNNLSNAQKESFLRFSTGSDRTPVGGLGSVRLIIQRTSDTEKLPISHTCFNMFALPDYQSKELLREKLIQALENAEGFELI